jgi:transcriptional regulator with XRE-family HTH domain
MKDLMFKTEIASRLRELRKQQGLSLDATAKLTGVSKAMLGQIEREESSPTIATLWKIASGLQASFSAFFANEPELRSAEMTFPDDARMQVNTLFPYREDAGFEMFEIHLSQYHSQHSGAHSVGVIEHVHVLSGQLNLLFDGEWHRLEEGDSERFYADQPHAYQAVSEKVVFQNIVSYPR